MARTWQYPRWRRVLMQSAMWVVLGATVALAALVDRNKNADRIVDLGPTVSCGPVSLQMPKGWIVRAETQQWGMINARGPVVRHAQRTLLVTTSTDPGNELLAKLLRLRPAPQQDTGTPKSVIPPHLLRRLPMEQQEHDERAIAMGSGNFSSEGMLILRDSTVEDKDGDDVPVGRQLIATGILPGGIQLTLRLEHVVRGLQELDVGEEDDIELLERIAGTVKRVSK